MFVNKIRQILQKWNKLVKFNKKIWNHVFQKETGTLKLDKKRQFSTKIDIKPKNNEKIYKMIHKLKTSLIKTS